MKLGMRMRFADSKIALVETDKFHKLGLPMPVIKTARLRLQFLREAIDERDLRAMKSLNFKKRKGAQDGEYTIRVNDQYRITFLIDEERHPHELVILSIGDTH